MSVDIHPDPSILQIWDVLQHVADDEIVQYESLSGHPWDHDSMTALLHQQPGPKWALVPTEGDAVAICGLVPLREGVYRTWMVTKSDAFETHGLGVTRCVRKLVNTVIADPNVHRIECLCLSARTKALDWYPRVGLPFEGTQLAVGVRGEDVSIFARVRR